MPVSSWVSCTIESKSSAAARATSELDDAEIDAAEIAAADPVDADPADASPADANPADANPADADPADANPAADISASSAVPIRARSGSGWPLGPL